MAPTLKHLAALIYIVGAKVHFVAAQSCVTVSGGGGSCTGLASAILSGQNNVVNGDRAAVVTGFAATASNTGATVVGGQFNTASGNNALVGGGQFSRAQGEFTVAFGTFGQATHDGSIVLAAKSGVEAVGDDVSLHCNSEGDNTLTICTANKTGVFVNGINLIAELNSKVNETTAAAAFQNLQDQTNAVQSDVSTLQLSGGLNQVLLNATILTLGKNLEDQLLVNQNLTEELDQIKAQLAVLNAKFENISAECLEGGARRLDQVNPCVEIAQPPSLEPPPPPPPPPEIVAAAVVGGALVLVLVLVLLVLLMYRRQGKPQVTVPKPMSGDLYGKPFKSKQSTRRSSASMSPPPYPPPKDESGEHSTSSSRIFSLYRGFRQMFVRAEEQGRVPPTPPPRPYGRQPSSTFSWRRFPRSPWILRSSRDDQRREEELREKEIANRDATLPVFRQAPSRHSEEEYEDEDEETSIKEAIF